MIPQDQARKMIDTWMLENRWIVYPAPLNMTGLLRKYVDPDKNTAVDIMLHKVDIAGAKFRLDDWQRAALEA